MDRELSPDNALESMKDTDVTDSNEAAGTLVELDTILASAPSTASTIPESSLTHAAGAGALAAAATTSSTTLDSSNKCSPHTINSNPATIPHFLQKLFAQEERRRLAAGPHRAQQRDGRPATVEVPELGSMTTPGATTSALPAELYIHSPNPSNSASQMPGLAYSASSAASSDTSSFPADMTDSDARSATSTMSCLSYVTSSNRKSSAPSFQHSASFSYHARPPGSQYDYASSASSTAGDDTFAAASEAGSVASRSTSPATKYAGAFSNNSTVYGSSSPSTSPFFHQNGGLHYLNYAQHQYHSANNQPNLQLQPLKLPPPSLDLPDPTETPSSSTTPSCATLSAFNGFVHPISPQGWTIGTANTSQTTTPGGVSPESSFSPGRTHRPRHQHYSPLHPFHVQGFLSPQRPRTLNTSLNILGPDLHDATVQDEKLLRPPDNLAMVCPGVYRSSFPSSKNFEFLKTLGLKTVLTLVQEEEYPQSNRDFFKNEKIRFLQIGIPGNKEPFVTIPDDKIRRALSVVLDKRNHPLLIHCNKGKHRTGCLVGCLRKMQCWSSTAIFEEYRRFSFPKSRAMDQLFIELFQPDWTCVETVHLPTWCEGEDAGLSGRVAANPSALPVRTATSSSTPSSTSPTLAETKSVDTVMEVR